jgi:long-subunit acyl-CoA synthetase (AMP-forming)
MKKNNNSAPFDSTDQNIITQLFALSQQLGEQPCIAEPRGNMVRKYSYAELADQVQTIAQAVSRTRNAEIKPIALVARSSFRSIATYFGVLLGGGKVILIPADCSIEEQEQLIADNQAELLITDDLESCVELMDRIAFLPQLRQIWALHEKQDDLTLQVSTLGWAEVRELAHKGKKRITFTQQLEQLDHSAKLCRFYRRNETNEFMHYDYSLQEISEETNDNYEWLNESTNGYDRLQRYLSVIPLNRISSHILGIYLPLFTGKMLMAVDRQESWKSAALPFTPDYLITSSGFLATTAQKLRTQITEQSGLTKSLFEANIARLKQQSRERDAEEPIKTSFTSRIFSRLLNRLLQSRLRRSFGGKISLYCTIDSDLRFEDRLFYEAIGVSFVQFDDESLSVSPRLEVAEDLPFTQVRGTQLEKNEDLEFMKIVG